jgi:antitoxin CptB
LSEASPELAKLRWRCRRGMRELDALLHAFLDESYAALSAAEKQQFAAILDLPDPELNAYVLGRLKPADRDVAALIERIRKSLHPQA